MQLVMTAMAVVAGMVFSLAVALLVEELIFGAIFRFFFVPRRGRKSAATVSTSAGFDYAECAPPIGRKAEAAGR